MSGLQASMPREKGRIVVLLKDGRGQPVTAKTVVRIVRANVRRQKEIRAVGEGEQVTRFAFDLPPGVYTVRVNSKGFKGYGKSVRVAASQEVTYEWPLDLEDPHDRGREGKGPETEALRGRFAWFATQRSRPGKSFPTDARLIALSQKERMSSPDVINAPLRVEPIRDPVPRSSFGSVGAYVKVDSRQRKGPFRRSLVMIPYSADQLGWVDENSLRVFEVDVKARRFRLVQASGVDSRIHCAFAYVDSPGVYGVIGLPKHPAVLETIRLFCRLREEVFDNDLGIMKESMRRICQVILCAPDFERSASVSKFGLPIPPGGVGGNICDFCLGVEPPLGGLPECYIIDAPPGPIVTPGCNWLSVGPRNINGRIRALAIHPTDGNTIFAGSANGGIWISRDAGQSWKPTMDYQPALEIGAVAVHLTDPANPMGNVTIFAGTGEPTSWPGYKGVGVLKSTDTGVTWNSTGAMPAPGNDRFSVISIDPTSVTANPATTIVYAGGTPGGLYRSADGGATWQLMLGKNITGLAMDPTNPAILYAAVANEGIYKYDPTTSTWGTMNAGLPAAIPQLVAVAIGLSAPHKLYAKLDQTVYVYNTVTSTWQSLGNHGSTTYGYWNNVLAVDPQNSDIVFAGGMVFERTPDGGTTWQSVVGLHPDQHALVFDSTNHLNAYAGNDGGVYHGAYISTTDTGTWTKVSDGLVITQFNQVGTSPAGMDIMGGGSQDNGTNRTVGGLTWDNILGADGGFFVVDPANPYVLYAETQSGGIWKNTSGGAPAAWISASSGFPGGPWVTPIVLDPNSPLDPNRILFAGGSSQVYRSANSAGTWSPSSPSLGGEVYAIALAPSTSAVVYAGSAAGQVWRSSDNGATLANWRNITVGTIAGSATLASRSVTDIAVDPNNPDILYVTVSGVNGATPGHVFRGSSSDGWTTWSWKDISSNLPDIPANAIVVDRTSPNTLYVGTDVGVFRTIDGGLSWSDFGPGLPNVVVTDLALNADGDILRAATYGRGMFEIRLSGTCPDQDVYVRDNKLDTGEQIPSPSGVADPTTPGAYVYWWESADIKVDAYPYYSANPLHDGVEFDLATPEDVIRNDAAHPNPNRLYVQVHNRGPLAAHNVKVKVLWADASAGLPPLPADFWTSFPNDWTAASPWKTVDAAVPFQNIPELIASTPNVLLWSWTVPPTAAEHTCMLAVISADEDPVSRSDANPNDHLPWIVVPNDKHIALRNLHVITGAAPPGPPGPLVALLNLNNPFAYPQYFETLVDLSEVPRGATVRLLLPKVLAHASSLAKGADGPALRRLTGKEPWMRRLKGLPHRGWHYECRFEKVRIDPCAGRRLAVLPSVLIPAAGQVRIGIVVVLPRNLKPGSSFRVAFVQRHREVILGGSTYEVRIRPANVSVR